MGLVVGELPVGAEGGLHVRKDVTVDGHRTAELCQTLVFVSRGLEHSAIMAKLGLHVAAGRTGPYRSGM